MPSIVVDSGPLYALFDRDDRFHGKALEFIEGCRDEIVTNLAVVGEVAYLLHSQPEARKEFLVWSSRALTVDQSTMADMPRIVALLDKYRDLPADFADASLIALAERRRITRIASFDSDFHVYRMLGGRALSNIIRR